MKFQGSKAFKVQRLFNIHALPLFPSKVLFNLPSSEIYDSNPERLQLDSVLQNLEARLSHIFLMDNKNISFASFGLVVLDQIRFPNRKHLTNVLGGSGAYGWSCLPRWNISISTIRLLIYACL